MKENIHPNYKDVTVNCVCGASFQTKSTKDLAKVDICSNCHPYYTGKQKVLDTEGRIEKFKKKFGADYSANLTKKK